MSGFWSFRKKTPVITSNGGSFPIIRRSSCCWMTGMSWVCLFWGSRKFGEDYVVTPLFTKKIVLLAYEGHPLYNAESVTFEQLQDEPIIMEGSDFWFFDFFRKKCISHGFCPNIIAETGDISFCHKLCSMQQGLGISVDFVAEFIRTPNVRMIPFADPAFLWPVGLVRHRNVTLSPAGQKFCQFLQFQFGGI